MNDRAEQLVANAKREIPDLAVQYGGKWDDLFRPLAKLFVDACEVVEQEASQLIGLLHAEVKAVFGDFESKVKTKFDKVCQDALADLKTDIRVGYFALKNRNQTLKVQIAEAERALPGLEKNVRAQKFAMAGHEGDIEVPPQDTNRRDTQTLWTRAGLLIGAASVEYWAGFPTWADISSPNTAIWLSILFIAGTAFGSWAGMHYKRYQVRLDAERDSKAKFPGKHPEGFVADPIPTAEKMTALGGMSIVGTILLAFFASRIWVILQGRDNLMFYLGSFALFVIFVASPIVSFALTKPYSKKQYDALREAQDKLVETKGSIIALKTQLGEGKKAFRVSSDAAHNTYKKVIAEARQSAVSEARILNEKRIRLVELLRDHEANLAVIASGFPESCNILVEKVNEEFRLSDLEAPFRNPSYEASVKSWLNGHRSHRWQEPGLRDLQRREFVATLPEDGLADLGTVETEVRMDLPKWNIGASEEETPINVDEVSHADL